MTLTNVLPGFRQLRAPLAAGYLWLLFIYLVGDLNEADATSGLTKQITDLGEALSPVGVAVAISFAAYLVGSLSNWIGRGVTRVPALVADPRGAPQPRLSARGFGALEDLLAPRVASGEIRSLDEGRRLARDVLAELDLIKTRLLGRDPELHAEIDRLHAEADFRFALLLPLTAVSMVGVLEIPVEAVGQFIIIMGVLLVVEVFAFQALDVLQQANDKLLDALFLERVESPALERWVRETAG